MRATIDKGNNLDELRRRPPRLILEPETERDYRTLGEILGRYEHLGWGKHGKTFRVLHVSLELKPLEGG